jgi:hypothetical protein
MRSCHWWSAQAQQRTRRVKKEKSRINQRTPSKGSSLTRKLLPAKRKNLLRRRTFSPQPNNTSGGRQHHRQLE